MHCFSSPFSFSCLHSLWACLLAGLVSGNAQAEVTLWGGRPALGMAYEYEKMSDQISRAQSITLMPGLSFKDAGVHHIDLLVNVERDKTTSGNTSSYSHVQRLALRALKNVPLQGELSMSFRALAGRVHGSSDKYFYGYSEAALHYDHNALGISSGLRVQRALDNSSGHDLNKIWVGPRFDIADQHALELRWERAWVARTNVRDSDAYIVEYSYKF